MASDSPSASDQPQRAAPPQSHSVDRTAQSGGKPSLRILIVDDLADAADSLALLLRIGGHDVRTAYTGPAAITAAELFQPEVVLLDIALPALDGYQVARSLRQMPTLQRACLIAVSGYGRDSDVQQAYQAGFNLHLLKPVSVEQLTAAIADFASRLA